MIGIATKILVIALMAALVSGCSIKFAYNNLDTLMRWGVNDYVKLTGDQEDWFSAEVDRVLYWHRTTHLPMYADFIEDLPTILGPRTTAEDTRSIADALFAWGDEVESMALPIATEMLISMTDEQLARLPEKLEKGNAEVEKEERGRDVDQNRKRWAKDFEDIFERLSGKLSRDQRQYLREVSLRYQPERVLWADYRRRWQAELLKILQRRDQHTWFTAEFHKLSRARESYWGEDLSRVFRANEALGHEASANLFAALDRRQRERFSERMNELAQDMRELVDDASTSAPPGGGCLVRCASDPVES